MKEQSFRDDDTQYLLQRRIIILQSQLKRKNINNKRIGQQLKTQRLMNAEHIHNYEKKFKKLQKQYEQLEKQYQQVFTLNKKSCQYSSKILRIHTTLIQLQKRGISYEQICQEVKQIIQGLQDHLVQDEYRNYVIQQKQFEQKSIIDKNNQEIILSIKKFALFLGSKQKNSKVQFTTTYQFFKILFVLFPIVIVLADEFSDIAFLYQTWDKFPTLALRNLTLFFAFFQTFFLTFYQLFTTKIGLKDKGNKIKLIFSGIMGLTFCLIWSLFRFTEVIRRYQTIQFSKAQKTEINPIKKQIPTTKWFNQEAEKQNQDQDQESEVKVNPFKQVLMYVWMDTIFQSLPQFIVQYITNQRIGQWTSLAKFSNILSIIVIIYAIHQAIVGLYQGTSQFIPNFIKRIEMIKQAFIYCWVFTIIPLPGFLIGILFFYFQDYFTHFITILLLTAFCNILSGIFYYILSLYYKYSDKKNHQKHLIKN